MSKRVIAIDVGGTQIRVALVNEQLEILKLEVTSSRECKTKEKFLTVLKEMVENVDLNNQVTDIALVYPAPYIKNIEVISDVSNIPYLENTSVMEIKQALKAYRVHLENDVNVIALLESEQGAAKPYNHSIYMTISTGIGSGIVLNNQVLHGETGYAGEIGSIIVDGINSLEDLCGGLALEQKSKELFGDHATPQLLFEKVLQKDELAITYFNLWIDYLTTGIAAVIQVINPGIIILGGPVILHNNWILEDLETKIKQKVLGQLANKIKITCTQYKTESGIIGAAYYALKQSAEGK